MKKKSVLFIALILVCFSFTSCLSLMSASVSTGSSTVTIVNNTGYLVYYVYFSPTSDQYWGPDRLSATQTLRNGQSVTLNLPYPISQYNRYDFLLVDLDGDGYVRSNVQLRGGDRIVFTFSHFVGRRF